MDNVLPLSPPPPTRILLIEDNPGDARLIEEYLRNLPGKNVYTLDVVQSITEGVERIHAAGYDVILTDLSLPDSDGMLSIHRLLDAAPEIPLVVLTGMDDNEMAKSAVREGAQEYLVKGRISADALARVLHYSINRHNQVSELRHMAYHDPLTGLVNKQMFLHTLEHDIALAGRNGHAVGMHFLDVDNFKEINDTYGHEMGDEFLRQLTTRLQTLLRGSDTLGRFGGDEFLIIQNVVHTTENVLTLAGKIVSSFAQPVICNGQPVETSLSVGVAIYPNHATDAESLICKADKALYMAKTSGKNRYRFFTDN